MTQIISKINTRSDEFKTNAEAMQAQLRDLHEVTHAIHQGGGEAARAKHEGRGKLLARVPEFFRHVGDCWLLFSGLHH